MTSKKMIEAAERALEKIRSMSAQQIREALRKYADDESLYAFPVKNSLRFHVFSVEKDAIHDEFITTTFISANFVEAVNDQNFTLAA